MSAEEDQLAAETDELRSIIPVHGRRPALGWESLSAWELAHGVVLPEPYRSFIAEIANGSVAGPPADGGLLALGELPISWSTWESDNWFSDQPFDGSAPRTPSTPFPLAEEWQWEYDCAPFEQRQSLITATYLQGSVLLGSEKPGWFWTLVTTGEQRGQVWVLSDGCAAPYSGPARDPLQPGLGFLAWVRQWHKSDGWWR